MSNTAPKSSKIIPPIPIPSHPPPQAPHPPSSTRHVACANVGATSPDNASSSCCAAAGSPWSSTLSQSSNLEPGWVYEKRGWDEGNPEEISFYG
jgi:hypothetical protein